MTTTRIPSVILAVDDQRESRDRLQAELMGRYGRDYRVVIESSPAAALATLRGMQDCNEPVAVVMASLWMAEMTGLHMLSAVKDIHPRTKRALVIPFGGWGHKDTADAIRRGIASGCIDYYLLQPWRTPDEVFHRTLAEFLYEWARSHEGTSCAICSHATGFPTSTFPATLPRGSRVWSHSDWPVAGSRS